MTSTPAKKAVKKSAKKAAAKPVYTGPRRYVVVSDRVAGHPRGSVVTINDLPVRSLHAAGHLTPKD